MHQLLDLDGDVVARAWVGPLVEGGPIEVALTIFNPTSSAQTITTAEGLITLRDLLNEMLETHSELTAGG